MICRRQMPSYKNFSLFSNRLKQTWHNYNKSIMFKYKMMLVIYNKCINYMVMKLIN